MPQDCSTWYYSVVQVLVLVSAYLRRRPADQAMGTPARQPLSTLTRTGTLSVEPWVIRLGGSHAVGSYITVA
eukprot:scaffold6706_cov119-Isochrysis_galbana.AAC.2